MRAVPRLALAAIRGGSGKTALTLGLTAAWKKQGRTVSTFKKGPDFIDAGWLGAASARPCYNLDLFLMDEEDVRRSFIRHTADADAAVIEGNRGLYDGMDESGTYSTARLARTLQTPVILIVDCTKATATMAAVVLGCKVFDPDLPLRGVILNRVASERQTTVITKAVRQATGLPVVGSIPRLRKEEFPERHMGLTPFQEHPDVGRAIAAWGGIAEQHLDLDALWQIAKDAPPLAMEAASPARPAETGEPVTIGVIQDRAFQFYYPDNLEALEDRGAVIERLNALNDTSLPEIDALYIGGGFPETHAAELAANERFCRSLRDAVEAGLPVYAECGGLIFLGRTLRIRDRVYPMAGVLPADFALEQRPQAHGYTVLEAEQGNPFFEQGEVLKGHEFHYSRILNPEELPPGGFLMKRGAGIDGRRDGLIHRNLLAAYSHLHALGSPAWAEGMVRQAREHRKRTRQVAG